MSFDENSPVIIGVGQAMEPVPGEMRMASSYVDLATLAVNRSLKDTGSRNILAHIDTVATVRTFEDSLPGHERAFNGPRNLPGAVANRIGASPREQIYDKLGGQSPQRLVNEFALKCHRGECKAALLFGVEVIANIKAARRGSIDLDWSETVEDQFIDRGQDEALELIGKEAMRHRVVAPMQFYGLMETAHRLELGLDRDAYLQSMGALFAPFSEIAANNPYAQFPKAMSAAELTEPCPDNPLLVSPYPRNLVAKNSVNQAAAVLVTTAGQARQMSVPQDRCVYLHGSADINELPFLERPRLGRSFALRQAVLGALEAAKSNAASIAHFDIYSCFPIVVFEACDALDIEPVDGRPLTQTGGLPYFGGPGNNYSMHAIAALAATLRSDPGSFGLVYANGGFLSKHSVGIYSTTPCSNWRPGASDMLQETVSRQARISIASRPQTLGKIESWVVNYRHGEPESVVIIGRQQSDESRFMAVNRPEDADFIWALAEHDPDDLSVMIEPTERFNLFRPDRSAGQPGMNR